MYSKRRMRYEARKQVIGIARAIRGNEQAEVEFPPPIPGCCIVDYPGPYGVIPAPVELAAGLRSGRARSILHCRDCGKGGEKCRLYKREMTPAETRSELNFYENWKRQVIEDRKENKHDQNAEKPTKIP